MLALLKKKKSVWGGEIYRVKTTVLIKTVLDVIARVCGVGTNSCYELTQLKLAYKLNVFI